MDEVTVSSLGITWDEVITFLKTSALDFGIALITAIVIFYVGRVVVRMITRGIRKVMDARQVDKTLVTFVSNLVNMILMVVVVIADVGALGVQTTSFIAILGAAGLAIGLADVIVISLLLDMQFLELFQVLHQRSAGAPRQIPATAWPLARAPPSTARSNSSRPT